MRLKQFTAFTLLALVLAIGGYGQTSATSHTSFVTLEMNQLGGTVALDNLSGGDANAFKVGETWRLSISKAPANTALKQLTNAATYPPPFKVVGTTDAAGSLTLTGTVGQGADAYSSPLYMLFPNTYAGYVDPNAPAGYRNVFVASAPLPLDPSYIPPSQSTFIPYTTVSPANPAPTGIASTPVVTAPAVVTPLVPAPNVVVPSATIIQYTSDFTSVTYLDATGATVTVPFTDGQRFSDLVAIRGMQVQALADNQAAAAAYNLAVQNAQISVNAGRGPPALPAKPQQKVVSNTGAVSFVDFNPPLLSIVPLVVNAPNSGQIKSTVNVPADPVAQSAAQQTVIMNMLQAIMAALKSKGIM